MGFIKNLKIEGLLSFGKTGLDLPLENLNVLIGPNGSGKSNLIEAIGLLRAAPGDMSAVIRRGGGIKDWIWKGSPAGEASIEVILERPKGFQSLRHKIAFREDSQRFHIVDEFIENEVPNIENEEPYFYYRYQRGKPVVNVQAKERRLNRESVEPDISILAQRRDPETYPELSYLASSYEKIRLYREWAFGRHTIFREPQKTDLRSDRLEEDFSNLGLFLNRLRRDPKVKNELITRLQDLYSGLQDFEVVIIEGGTVQVFFTEGDYTIPATRLSDGSLRFLCLLAILLDPTPPPLICIEEPELGLHPDLMPKIADLLIAASARTQLIVTTHSDILVDALTDTPEAVLVCEKHDGETTINRLKPDRIGTWLEKYRLGELWSIGEIGGNRW
jgi:predicted ATPase